MASDTMNDPKIHLAEVLEKSFDRQGIAFSRLDNFKRLTGGSSHDTWAFDLFQDSSEEPDQALIMRRTYADAVLGLPLDQEFHLMKWLYDTGQQVPKQFFFDREGGGSPTSFSICERISGTDLRKAIADPDISVEKSEVGSRLVAMLAQLHTLDLSCIPSNITISTGQAAVEKELQVWTRQAFEAVDVKAYPLIHAAIHWLEKHVPEVPRLTLVHGDFKNNNVLYSDSGELVILDWELAHVGDPLEDLAWTMLWASQYDLVGGIYSMRDFVAAYEAASQARVDLKRLFYWQLYALVKLSVILLTGSGTLTSASTPTMTHTLLARSVPSLEQGIAAFMQKTLSYYQGEI